MAGFFYAGRGILDGCSAMIMSAGPTGDFRKKEDDEMGVLRLGHLELRVPNFDESVKYYTQTIGLREMDRDAEKIYLKCFDEYDHHSVVLRKGDKTGLDHAGFKVEKSDDLAEFENKLEARGIKVQRMANGEEHKLGEAIRFRLPTGQLIELYASMEQPGREVGHMNPEPWPRNRVGVNPYRLDHMLCGGQDVSENIDIFQNVLGFSISEQVLGPDNETRIGAFMFRSNTAHDIAFLPYPEDHVFHHLAFWVEDKAEMIDTCDVLGRDNVPIEFGLDRHGITRGLTTYFFDPAGNRNEVFSSSYLAQADMPVTTWTFDQIAGKGGRSMDRRTGLTESFLQTYTFAF